MNPLQRASWNRKIVYFVLIVVLFTGSMVWRGMIGLPLADSTAAAAAPFRWAANHTIQSQAQRLELWEADPTESDAEISGNVVRLTLTGSRGLAVTILWQLAIEKQKRNDFHEFERLVQMVTKLQPNFVTPWIFQSWNITYNVSVEMQGGGDMYYYIVRGIQLLAEGERRNKRSPDMRYWIAFYYQNKFGVSDQKETLQCMYDLSCIPPGERNPDNFVDPTDKSVRREAFRKFCEQHPHLVRRLRGEDVVNPDKRARERLRNPAPEDVIQFLRDNQQVPGRYTKTDDLKDGRDATVFPVLPPQFDAGTDLSEPHPGLAAADDYAPGVGYFSAFKAARAWFSYSLPLLPPPILDEQERPIPGPTPRPGEFGYNPSKHRVPRAPMLIIFRQGAPRAQSYCAELEQKEGWFDGEGWRIDDPVAAPSGWWFPAVQLSKAALPELKKAGVADAVVQKLAASPLPDATLAAAAWDRELARVLDAEELKAHRDAVLAAATTRPLDVVVGTNREWSLAEWDRASLMWRRHGEETGLTLSLERRQNLKRIAGDAASVRDANPEEMDAAARRRYLATTALLYYDTQRNLTNFEAFRTGAEAEAWRDAAGVPITVVARKALWKADQARKQAKKDLAIRLYKDGLEKWKTVLAALPNFHRLPPPDHNERVEEETCEFELAYQRLLVQDDDRVSAWANKVSHAAHAVVPFLAEPFPKGGGPTPQWPSANREELKWYIVETVGGQDFSSPFVGSLTPTGEPWISDGIRELTRTHQGVTNPQRPGAEDGRPPEPRPVPDMPGPPGGRPPG